MIRHFTVILLLIISATGQATMDQKPAHQLPEDWKTYDQPEYTVRYPETWELNLSGQMGTSFILFTSLESEQDQFRENITLLIQDLAGHNLDLDTYTKISEGQVETMVTNPRLLESKRMKKGKEEYHKMVYTGDQGIFHLLFEQYYWVINDKAYVLTFTTEQDKYEAFREAGEKVLDSFTLKI